MNLGTAFTKFILENIEVDCQDGLVGLEVGTRDGANALDLVRYLPIKKLYLVDSFPAYDDVARIFTEEDQDEEIKKLVKNTEHIFDKVFWIRQPSEKALNIFDDLKFDFVYIDGNHDSENVKIDMKWWDKVRIGGIFGGHDYGGFDGEEVKKAVDEFVTEKNKKVFDLGGRIRTPGGGGGGIEWAILK